MVAYAALRLTLAGGLDLAEPVSRYLPQGYRHDHGAWRRGPDDPHDIVPAAVLSRLPLWTLLNHTSGLPNESAGAPALLSEPGQTWRYSGAGYRVLQAVIESVTGVPLAAYIAAQVFAPLGMRDSSLVWEERFAGRAVAGRTASGSVREVRFHHAVAASSLYTTAGDYARFLSAFAADAPLVALAGSRPVPVSRELGLEWGYGWGIERTAEGLCFWQWGRNPGFRSFAMFSPLSRNGFVVLTNSDRGMALAVPVAEQALPADHKAFRFPMVG